jgi:hypothetical protein
MTYLIQQQARLARGELLAPGAEYFLVEIALKRVGAKRFHLSIISQRARLARRAACIKRRTTFE